MNCRLPVILLAAGLSACVTGGGDDWRLHYVTFSAAPPQGNRVTICHAYTCKEQTPYTFRPKDVAEISAIMTKVKRADTPFEERRGVAYAIAHMEVKVGHKLGIKDAPGMQFTASGDPSQQDCVDEATNTTSYLLVLQSNGLLKHHTVAGTMSKENLARGVATLNPVEVLAALDGGADRDQDRPEICGRFLAVPERREPRRGQGRGLVHQGQLGPARGFQFNHLILRRAPKARLEGWPCFETRPDGRSSA